MLLRPVCVIALRKTQVVEVVARAIFDGKTEVSCFGEIV